ncbi:MAG: class II fructose-bisphosphate aldolase, partial [Chloroflexota bacterium]|nr:class II fructose-bisphosphate aldolase [Chloroflexota bacterium]
MLVEQPRAYLQYAYEQRFAMPAFNVCNLEMAKAVIEAAMLERAPVIVQTYPGDLAHAGFGTGLGPLPSLIKALAAEATIPVFLHLDHGPGFEFNLRCLQAGYSSVMFDGHQLPIAEALAETAAIARMAHALDAAVEGELGTFGGDQGSQEFTEPDEAPLMFQQGHIDMLAVSVGSEHG